MSKHKHHRQVADTSGRERRADSGGGHPRALLQPDAAKGSVRSLQELYTVAMGVALVKAMELFVGPSSGHGGGGAQQEWWTNWPALAAFIATLVPFYHGAMRHLDSTYIENRGVYLRRGALLADFLWLFVEACILLGMALHINDPRLFAWWLVVLLLFDSSWGLFVHLVLTTKSRGWTEFKWAIVNISTAIFLGVALASWAQSDSADHAAPLRLLVPTIALARTAVDYAWSWSFYFPTEEEARQP